MKLFKKLNVFVLLVVILLTNLCFSFPENSENSEVFKSVWPSNDQLSEIPYRIKDVKQSLISLNGEWEFCDETNQENWDRGGLIWNKIIVPGEPAMQGYPIKHDTWYAYRKAIIIPKDFSGKKVALR
ncbi:MAG TPA: hypothetical protein VIK20_00920, partial [Bacteroidales bacterium]